MQHDAQTQCYRRRTPLRITLLHGTRAVGAEPLPARRKRGVRFKVLQQVKQLLMYRTPVSSPKALDQSTAGTAARWATRSAKLGGASRLRTRRRTASSMGSGAAGGRLRSCPCHRTGCL